jgi:hypothetical protein
VPVGELTEIQDAIGGLPPPPARTLAHRQVPPLRVALSRAWLALAEVYRARDALGPHSPFAETVAGQRSLDLARVEVARRMRLPKSDPAVRQALRETCTLAEAPRVYEAVTLLGEGSAPPPDQFRSPAHLHAWWHAQAVPSRTLTLPGLAQRLQAAHDWCPADQAYLQAALALDYAELERWPTAAGPPVPPLRPVPGGPAAGQREWRPDPDDLAWRLALRAGALRGQIADLTPLTVPAPPRPGVRRLAELALDEGELLALRVPAPGILLLAAARKWFEEADDPVGALMAHIAELLAAARRAGYQPDLAGLAKTYERASARLPDLPAWEHLGDEASYSRAALKMGRRARTSWEGWLLPLRWLQEGADPTWRGLDPGTTAIPPELGISRPSESAGPAVPAALRRWYGKAVAVTRWLILDRLKHRRVLLLAGSFSVLVLVVVVFIGLNRRLAAATAGLFPLDVLAVRVVLYVGLLIALAQAVALVVTTGPQNSWATIEVDPGPGPGTASIRVRAFKGRRWPRRSRRNSKDFGAVSVPQAGDPHRIPTLVHDLLRATATAGHPLSVSLLVAAPLAGVGWEAWVGGPLGDIALHLGRPYRSRLETVPEPSPLPQPRERPYIALSPPRWRSMVRLALGGQNVAFPDRFPAAAANDEPAPGAGSEPETWVGPGAEAVPGDVAIIMATAVDTASGRRLVVHNGQSRHNDLIVDPDEAALTGLTVIVVGEPRRERKRSSAPQATVALRACAADLMEAGARTVVVVPNAPSAVVSGVLACLVGILRPGSYCEPDQLAEVVAQARAVMARTGSTDVADLSAGYELTVMSRAS